jgi:hypothetical protein
MHEKRGKFKNELYHSATERNIVMRLETLSDMPQVRTLTDAWSDSTYSADRP